MQKPASVDEYLDVLEPNVRECLEHLRVTIKKAAPDATEKISYNMPGFQDHGVICWYAAFKNHYSLFFRPKVHEEFADALSAFERTKSAIHIPYDRKFPAPLLTKMVKHVVLTNRMNKKK